MCCLPTYFHRQEGTAIGQYLKVKCGRVFMYQSSVFYKHKRVWRVRNIFRHFCTNFLQMQNGANFSIFHLEKCETASKSGTFFCGDAMSDTAQWSWFLLTTRKTQKAAGSWPFFLEIFWDRCFEKVASQSLSYGIFTKTSGYFNTFSIPYAEGEKLEETLNHRLWHNAPYHV